MNTFINIFVILIFLFSVYSLNDFEELEEVWWGPKELEKHPDTRIKPFRVVFEDEVIRDLRNRLRKHRSVTPPLEHVGFQYGFNTDFLDHWVDYWANEYTFKAREAYLNQFPQYKTNIQGLDIHFIWVTPQVPPEVTVVPLLFLHGWPGTVRELQECIHYLTLPNATRSIALEIVAPNLPGFGFSSAAIRPGLGATEMAVVLRNLMLRLGFNKFYIQGGDWGSSIGTALATLYPEEVLGYHTNFPIARSPLALTLWIVGSQDPSQVVNKALEDRLYPLQDVIGWLVREFGYFYLHATKPDSLGVAMSDSPTGLLAYILQLISSGTRHSNPNTQDGGLEEHYSRDSLLDILTIIWVTNSFTTSARIYAETINLRTYNSSLSTKPTPVPTWTVHAKDEIFYQSPNMLKFKFPNLLHSTILEEGGHFIAFEKPKIFADDIFQAIGTFKQWHDMKNYRNEL